MLVTVVLVGEILLAGCLHVGEEPVSGKPVSAQEAGLVLVRGSPKAEVVAQLGEPSWVAAGGRIHCYEGVVDHGRPVWFYPVVALVSLGGQAVGPDPAGNLRYGDPEVNSHRVLLYFGEDDRLRETGRTARQEELEHTRLSDLIEFSRECGLADDWLTEESLRAVHGSGPGWRHPDGRIVFFGTIIPENGDVNGTFIRFDDTGSLESYRRKHFRRLVVGKRFEEQLESLMLAESEGWAYEENSREEE